MAFWPVHKTQNENGSPLHRADATTNDDSKVNRERERERREREMTERASTLKKKKERDSLGERERVCVCLRQIWGGIPQLSVTCALDQWQVGHNKKTDKECQMTQLNFTKLLAKRRNIDRPFVCDVNKPANLGTIILEKSISIFNNKDLYFFSLSRSSHPLLDAVIT